MQKDVVYIDVEDDITAIIGKVKASKEKIVALVPPKRIGILQSAVNLRLLGRAAHGSHKHLVLITNNQALMALSAAAKIPVAKNLQSKPELAEIPALSVDDEDDIIDGENLPVGELAKMAPSGSSVPDSAISGLDVEDDTPKATPPVAGSKLAKPRIRSGIKVPSFDAFRKKVFIFGGLGVLAIAFLIWAIFFAAQATVIIDARTTKTDVKTAVAIGPSLATDAEASTLKSLQMQDKQTQTVEFDGTGTQDVGEKAKGTVTIRNCVTPVAQTINAGTNITTGGKNYIIQATVIVPGANGNFITGCTSAGVSGPVNVEAADIGDEYNVGANANFSIESSAMTATTAEGMAGGSKRQIKIVTQADVVAATEKLSQLKQEDAKKKLVGKFDKNTIVIDDSFLSTPAAPQATPAIGQELKEGKAKLTSEVTYSMSGVTKGDLSAYLKTALEKQLNGEEQRVYSDGAKDAKLTSFKQNNGNTTVSLQASGEIGPKINDDQVKETAKGKKFGEIQTELKKVEGVNDVEVKFSPFWVSTVPNDNKKIKIEFKLRNDS